MASEFLCLSQGLSAVLYVPHSVRPPHVATATAIWGQALLLHPFRISSSPLRQERRKIHCCERHNYLGKDISPPCVLNFWVLFFLTSRWEISSHLEEKENDYTVNLPWIWIHSWFKDKGLNTWVIRLKKQHTSNKRAKGISHAFSPWWSYHFNLNFPIVL